jgi:hypothetical protein
MREWDEDTLPVDATAPHGFAERNASPEALDRERSDEQHDTRSHQRELGVQPRGAERDLRRRRTPIPCSARRLTRKALRDRGAIWEMRCIDAGLREPASQLRTRASRERKPRCELDRAGRLADDHHAIARLARDDRERGRQIARIDALRACADAQVKTCECALSRDHDITSVGTRGVGDGRTASRIHCGLERGVAQPGSATVWGTVGPGFKSRHPDRPPRPRAHDAGGVRSSSSAFSPRNSLVKSYSFSRSSRSAGRRP